MREIGEKNDMQHTEVATPESKTSTEKFAMTTSQSNQLASNNNDGDNNNNTETGDGDELREHSTPTYFVGDIEVTKRRLSSTQRKTKDQGTQISTDGIEEKNDFTVADRNPPVSTGLTVSSDLLVDDRHDIEAEVVIGDQITMDQLRKERDTALFKSMEERNKAFEKVCKERDEALRMAAENELSIERVTQERDEALKAANRSKEETDIILEVILNLSKLAALDPTIYRESVGGGGRSVGSNASQRSVQSINQDDVASTRKMHIGGIAEVLTTNNIRGEGGEENGLDGDDYDASLIQYRLDNLHSKWKLEETQVPTLIRAVHRLQSNLAHMTTEMDDTTLEMRFLNQELDRSQKRIRKLEKALQDLYRKNRELKETVKRKRKEKKYFVKNMREYVSGMQKINMEEKCIENQLRVHERLLQLSTSHSRNDSGSEFPDLRQDGSDISFSMDRGRERGLCLMAANSSMSLMSDTASDLGISFDGGVEQRDSNDDESDTSFDDISCCASDLSSASSRSTITNDYAPTVRLEPGAMRTPPSSPQSLRPSASSPLGDDDDSKRGFGSFFGKSPKRCGIPAAELEGTASTESILNSDRTAPGGKLVFQLPKIMTNHDSSHNTYQLTFPSGNKIGLQFQKLPISSFNSSINHRPISGALSGPANLGLTFGNKDRDGDAFLVCGFNGFDCSINVRPTIGARLIAVDGESIEDGKCTLREIKQNLDRRAETTVPGGSKPTTFTLTFRNDPLSKEQKEMLHKAVAVADHQEVATVETTNGAITEDSIAGEAAEAIHTGDTSRSEKKTGISFFSSSKIKPVAANSKGGNKNETLASTKMMALDAEATQTENSSGSEKKKGISFFSSSKVKPFAASSEVGTKNEILLSTKTIAVDEEATQTEDSSGSEKKTGLSFFSSSIKKPVIASSEGGKKNDTSFSNMFKFKTGDQSIIRSHSTTSSGEKESSSMKKEVDASLSMEENDGTKNSGLLSGEDGIHSDDSDSIEPEPDLKESILYFGGGKSELQNDTDTEVQPQDFAEADLLEEDVDEEATQTEDSSGSEKKTGLSFFSSSIKKPVIASSEGGKKNDTSFSNMFKFKTGDHSIIRSHSSASSGERESSSMKKEVDASLSMEKDDGTKNSGLLSGEDGIHSDDSDSIESETDLEENVVSFGEGKSELQNDKDTEAQPQEFAEASVLEEDITKNSIIPVKSMGERFKMMF